jgi:UDP-N-acetylmuramyl pentapeptide phosphotransferase/UDP-N-acetylglucosamine-1-phosphate transferase
MLPALFIAFSVAAILSWRLACARGYWLVLDIPNERSLHSRPTPRTGGIAILLGIGAGIVIAWLGNGYSITNLPVSIAVLALALVALLDDRYALGVMPRLLMQICVVSILIFTLPLTSIGIVAPIASLLFLLWMVNLYNFMDGMDGFAAGMAIFGFSTYAMLAWQAGYTEFAFGCAIIGAASSGFMLLNFPPARLFMGDSGSTVLGLLAGVAVLFAHRESILPVWLGVLVFSPFIVDATVTLGMRILRREKFWQAHKTHYYQRLVRLGWGHRRTVLAEYGLMLACCGSAVHAAGLDTDAQILIIAGWSVVYAGLIFLIRRTERSKERQHETLRPST